MPQGENEKEGKCPPLGSPRRQHFSRFKVCDFLEKYDVSDNMFVEIYMTVY